LFDACKNLIDLAGSFNHTITWRHKEAILELLVSVGEDAITPALEALVDCPRAEQFDITQLFIRKLMKR
jgi:hypothetical protein